MLAHDKAIDDISSFRVDTLDPILYSLQNEYWKNTKIRIILCSIFFATSIIFFLLSRSFPSGSYSSLFFGMCTALSVISTTAIATYTHTRFSLYQKQISTTVVNEGSVFIHPHTTVIPKWFISKNYFHDSNLFYVTPDDYKGELLVDFFINAIHIRSSFVSATYRVKRHRFHTILYQNISLFDGVCVTLTLPDFFEGECYFIPKYYNLLAIDTSEYSALSSGNSVFDDSYVVLSNKQTISQDILHAIVSYVQSVEENTGVECMISIIDKKVFIALPDTLLSFKTSWKGTLLHYRAPDKFCFILNSSLQLAHGLSKEAIPVSPAKSI